MADVLVVSRPRTAVAPYAHLVKARDRHRRRWHAHPARPLVWALVLTVVPAFWVGIIVWFANAL